MAAVIYLTICCIALQAWLAEYFSHSSVPVKSKTEEKIEQFDWIVRNSTMEKAMSFLIIFVVHVVTCRHK